ncbi:MAG TPA: hypothetical protein PKE31_15080 [Pseudomonadota bacterium]|nr:hypothetical protein [Pseudomonadota bacterium]
MLRKTSCIGWMVVLACATSVSVSKHANADEAGPPLSYEPTTYFLGIDGDELASRQTFEWLSVARKDARRLQTPVELSRSCEGPRCIALFEREPACQSARGIVVGGQWDEVQKPNGPSIIRVRAWRKQLADTEPRLFFSDKVCDSVDPKERKDCLVRHVARAPDVAKSLTNLHQFSAPECENTPRPAYCEPQFVPVQRKVIDTRILPAKPTIEMKDAARKPMSRGWLYGSMVLATAGAVTTLIFGSLLVGEVWDWSSPKTSAFLASTGVAALATLVSFSFHYHSQPRPQKPLKPAELPPSPSQTPVAVSCRWDAPSLP